MERHDLRLKTFNVWNAEHYSYIDGRSEDRTSLICMITKSNKEDDEFCAEHLREELQDLLYWLNKVGVHPGFEIDDYSSKFLTSHGITVSEYVR
jgi:hypothetical protein